MRTFGILALLMFLIAPAVAAPDRPAARPAFHEETSSVWDELTHRFRDMRDRFREHFGGSRDAPGERPLISLMLSHRDELNLSSEQVRNLERLRSDFEREAVKSEGDLRVAELDVSEILKADSVDVKKAEAKVREIERLRADLRIARIRAIEQAKAVLTPEQRDKLRTMTSGSRYSRRPE